MSVRSWFCAILLALLVSLPQAIAKDRSFYIDKTGKETSGPKVPVLPSSAVHPNIGRKSVQSTFTDGRAWYVSENLYGYMDESGKVVIPPQFDAPIPFQKGEFSEGFAICHLPGKGYVVIDRDGKITGHLPASCLPERPFVDGLAKIAVLESFAGLGKAYTGSAFVDHEGKLVIPAPSNAFIYDFSDGLASFSLAGDGGKTKVGFLNTKGVVVVIPKYDEVGVFADGLAPVKEDGRWSYINSSGNIVFRLPSDCRKTTRFSEGLAAVAFGGIDHKSPPFFAPDIVGAKLGFVDKTGKLVIPASFCAPNNPTDSMFVEGLAPVAVERNGYLLWGFIDKSGKFVIPPKFKTASGFYNGRAYVSTGAFAFDSEEWQHRFHDKICMRYDFFDEFVHEQPLIGMDRSKVTTLLGNPQKQGSGTSDVVTYTLIFGGPVDNYRAVEIEFKDGKASRYRIVESNKEGPWIAKNVGPNEFPRDMSQLY